MAPALGSRDLLVFDQRGTGSSGPLACPALESSAEVFGAIGQAFERCALQIGAARGSYTTQESVADIEAIRQATGYEKLVLFGVSYGTKVALEYAERYPQNVEALVLDSVVPPERDDPFSVGMFQAMKPVFEELCSAARLRRHHLRPARRHRAPGGDPAEACAERLRIRRLRPPPPLDAVQRGPAQPDRSRRLEPGPARAAAGLGAIGAARRSSSAAAPEPALGGADPELPGDPFASASRKRSGRALYGGRKPAGHPSRAQAACRARRWPAPAASTKRCSWTQPAKRSRSLGNARRRRARGWPKR